MDARIKAIQGMRDILPDQVAWWQRMEQQLINLLKRYSYEEIRTPIMEHTALFSRSIGEETDIVSKEMYTFADRNGSSLTLRPEGTASVVRAYLQNNFPRHRPLSRLYYIGPMFRHEHTQKGRYRQFYQMGAELIGAADPAADVELIDLMKECIRAVGLKGTRLEINSLGCPACRPTYREQLVGYLSRHEPDLCPDCQRRLKTNPLRVLDCKKDLCIAIGENAPDSIDHLCDDCRIHFQGVRAGLDVLSLKYQINHRIVRGLDYYNRTAFELIADGLGAQNAVAAGGRYDGLVSQLGGPAVPAIGFATGLDRILLLLMEKLLAPTPPPLVFVATVGDKAWHIGLSMMTDLRQAGFSVQSDVRRGSLKSQMKRADKEKARFVLIIGEEELQAAEVIVRDMQQAQDEQKQQRIQIEGVVHFLKRHISVDRQP